MKKLVKMAIIVLTIMSCTNGINQKNKKVEIDTILANDIVNALLEMDSTFSTNDFLYSKFLPYDNETESPVICWEKDSFSNRSVYEVPPPPSKSKFKNPLALPSKIANTYLVFLFNKEIGKVLSTEDTIYFRQQIEYSTKEPFINLPNKVIKMIDTVKFSDFKDENLKRIFLFSFPIFTKDKNFAFLRQYHQYEDWGSGEWLILQRINNKWELQRTGFYCSRRH